MGSGVSLCGPPLVVWVSVLKRLRTLQVSSGCFKCRGTAGKDAYPSFQPAIL